MRFIFASDSFKGSLSSKETGEILEKTARKYYPDCEIERIVIADGGEGTLEAVMEKTGGTVKKCTACNPVFERIETTYGVLPDGTAVIEMAKISGITLLKDDQRDPLKTTSFGTGELIADAVKSGYRRIILAIGGSATNDGGMGMMRALGMRFMDADGNELAGTGEDLGMVVKIDDTLLMPEIRDTQFILMCDVKNPLTGPDGATYTFGRQKGADDHTLQVLEKGMLNYAGKMQEYRNHREQIENESMIYKCCERNRNGISGKTVRQLEGGGAAGGIGAAAMVFLKAEMHSGIDTLLDLVGYEKRIKDADLIITGEGRVDWQSACGKVLYGIGERAKKCGVPAAAICGSLGEGWETILEHGISKVIPTMKEGMTLEEAIKNAEALYEQAADRFFRTLQIQKMTGQI